MIHSSIITHSLFKTVEYKLLNSSNLELNTLSKSGSFHSKTISLNSINIEKGLSTPSYLSWLVLFLGCILIIGILYASKNQAIISDNLISIVSFLVCTFGALGLLFKPTKSIKYFDSFSNNILFEFQNDSIKNNSTSQFIHDLDTAIENAKQVETDRSNFTPNSLLQFETHSENVNGLLNSGLIDESLYDRICSSMHDKFHGVVAESHRSDNVIYLKR